MESFPNSPSTFEQSLAATILARAAIYCGSLPLQPSKLDEYFRAVELARPALKTLAFLSFEEHSIDVPEVKGRAKRVPQRVVKKMRRAHQLPPIDQAIFARIGVSAPSSSEDALSTARQILDTQKDILKVAILLPLLFYCSCAAALSRRPA